MADNAAKKRKAAKDELPGDDPPVSRLPLRLYERELARLQTETVKLQEWVRQSGARLVVVFEGRDAAGKGSTIKRLTQYLNPRVARIVALPAPTHARRDTMVLPALRGLPAGGGRDRDLRPELVQPRRSRARHGLLHARRVPPLSPPVPDLRETARGRRHLAPQILVLRQRRRAGTQIPAANGRPAAALEALRDGSRIHQPVGRLHPREGRDVRAHRHPRRAVVRRRERGQAPQSHQHDRAPSSLRSRTTMCSASRSSSRRASSQWCTSVQSVRRSTTCPTTPRSCCIRNRSQWRARSRHRGARALPRGPRSLPRRAPTAGPSPPRRP